MRDSVEGVGAVGVTHARPSLARGTVRVLAVQGGSVALLLALQVTLSRLMGPEGYGRYAYVLSWTAALALLGTWGMDATVLRGVAGYAQLGQDRLLRGVLRAGVGVALASGLLVGSAAAAVGWAFGGELRGAFVVAGLAIVPLLAVLDIGRASLQGLHRAAAGLSLRMLVHPVAMLGLVGLAWSAGRRTFEAPHVLALEAGALALAVLLGAGLLRRWGGQRLIGPADYELGRWLGAGMALLVYQGFHVINTRADMLLLGALRGPASTGPYFAALQISKPLLLGLLAVGAVAAPRFAASHVANRPAEVERLLRWCLLGIAALTLPAAAGLVVAGPWLLGLFGSEFVGAYPALLVLVAAQTANALFGPVGYLMMMTGRQRQAAACVGLAAAANIALNLLLIPRLGLVGAALGTLASVLIWNGLIWVYLRQRLGMRVSVRPALGGRRSETPSRRPNFFLLGGPKSATTAMAAYLGEHPQAFMAQPKEPGYYATDLPNLRVARDEAAYLSLFAPAGPQDRVLGEATVWYLFSDRAVPNILADAPDARLMVMLRNPLQMLPSLYEHFRFHRVENAPNFAAAWHAQADRRAGRRIPLAARWQIHPRLLQYAEVGRLGAQLQRLVERAGRDRVCPVLFDDFVADPRGEYLRVLAFLGLDDDGRREFPPVNVTRRHHNQRGWAGSQAIALAARAKWRMGILPSYGLARRIAEIGSYRPQRQPLPEALRCEISDTLRDDVALLGQLLQRDLSGWLSPSSERARPNGASV